MHKDNNRRLPFFVYGTLLPGQPNYHLWEDALISEQPAILPNGRLYDVGHYPMLIAAEGESVKGMVIQVKAGHYEAILARLDHLEGYFPDRPEKSEYKRVQWAVDIVDGATVTAWVYLGQPGFVLSLPRVKHGDWPAHLQAKRTNSAGWWQSVTTVAGLHDSDEGALRE